MTPVRTSTPARTHQKESTMNKTEQQQTETERVGGWWRRLALTALDAVDPRTAARALVNGDRYDIAHR